MPLTKQTIEVVKATAPVVAENANAITKCFYETMFKNNPEVLAFFNKSHQHEGRQQRALADAVIAYASHIDNLGVLGPLVEKIAHRHCALSVKPEMYPIVHKNLMAAIGEVLGDAVTPEIGQGWSEAVSSLAEICIGAEKDLYEKAKARKGGWQFEREFEVAAKEKVADDTVRVEFAATDGYRDGFEFTPGQYLTLRVPEMAPRHYTITSAPGAPTLECTVRLVKDGQMSTYVHNEMKVSDKVLLGAPYGVFTPQEVAENSGAALISAGVGVTPMLSFLRHYNALNTPVYHLHLEHTPERFGFAETFKAAKDHKLVLTKDGRPNLDGELSELVNKAGNSSQYFICGPGGFMEAVQGKLESAGCKSVHLEVFGTGTIATNKCPMSK
mmetsp:Transcript_6952/g.11012  ORF Transcript_6952/g.11012 Transcript_6952/m.11012 type:complete len:385 (+) Transcript_6952:71-1225(+)